MMLKFVLIGFLVFAPTAFSRKTSSTIPLSELGNGISSALTLKTDQVPSGVIERKNDDAKVHLQQIIITYCIEAKEYRLSVYFTYLSKQLKAQKQKQYLSMLKKIQTLRGQLEDLTEQIKRSRHLTFTQKKTMCQLVKLIKESLNQLQNEVEFFLKYLYLRKEEFPTNSQTNSSGIQGKISALSSKSHSSKDSLRSKWIRKFQMVQIQIAQAVLAFLQAVISGSIEPVEIHIRAKSAIEAVTKILVQLEALITAMKKEVKKQILWRYPEAIQKKGLQDISKLIKLYQLQHMAVP